MDATVRPKHGTRLGLAGLSCLIVVCTVAAYLPAMRGEFIWDDRGHLTKPELRSVSGLGRIWFELGATQQYYPLLHSLFWIEHKLWGDAPLGYHLMNVILHALAAILLYLILRKLEIAGAYLAAFVFALHPVQVESVAWISEQKNTFSAVLYLCAAWTYMRFSETRRVADYGLAAVLFVASLLAKTVTATFPAAMLVVLWWKNGSISWRRDVRPLMPFFLAAFAAGLVTVWVERKLIGAQGAEFDLSAVQRFLLSGRATCFYLGKIFWPTNLAFIYPRWEINPSIGWQWLFPLAVLALVAAGVMVRHASRAPLAGLLFFIGTLFPALGFFDVYPFRYSYVADHFQYLASLGVIIPVCSGMARVLRLLQRPWRWTRPVLPTVLVLALGIHSWRQCHLYSDPITLFQATIRQNPDSWMAHYNLGTALANRGRTQEAIGCYERTLALKPDYPEVHNVLGTELMRAGRDADAVWHFRRATELKPDYADPHYNLGVWLTNSGRPEEAIPCFCRAVEADAGFAQAHNNWGIALAMLGRTDEAVARLHQALLIKPDYVDAHNNIGHLLLDLGRREEARLHFQRALKLEENSASAMQGMKRLDEPAP